MKTRTIVLETTYNVTGGTEEEAMKACCIVAAGITSPGKTLVPWELNGLTVRPSISKIVSIQGESNASE